jgi:hypothetical protein
MAKIGNVPLFGGPFADHVRDFDSELTVLFIPIMSVPEAPVDCGLPESAASFCYVMYHLERVKHSSGRYAWVGRYSKLRIQNLLDELAMVGFDER